MFEPSWAFSFLTLVKVLWRQCIDKGWQKAMEVMIICFAKNTGVEALKMHYRYAVIGFVCGSSTSIWSPEKCVIGTLSTKLFVV